MEELVAFLQEKKVIDREIVLHELFPRTCSGITNDINYWYDACLGALDRLIERGLAVKLEKGKYQWAGEERALAE